MKVLMRAFKKGSAIWERLYSKAIDTIKGPYYRRKSQYTHTGKVALCCIAKMENEYIRFFVEYYKNLYFDIIFIYDNNDSDGERFEEVIGDYIDNGFVEIVDFRGRHIAQLAAYQDCYDRYNKEFNWIAFFDCDEFLTFADESNDIHSFLNQKRFMPFQVMHINWQVYGDNELLDNDGRNIIERFELPIPYNTKGAYGSHLENEHVKSIVRGGLPDVIWDIDPHTPRSVFYRCCSAEGREVNVNMPFQSIHYETLFLRHYSTKTIGEWVRNKMKRGFPDRNEENWKELLNIEFFFRYNHKTDEKVGYAKKVLEQLKESKL
jgi:hypothetical protein